MATEKSLPSLLFLATVLLTSGCSPDSPRTWRIEKEGTFDASHVFYEQFGAAAYQLSTSFAPSSNGNIAPGSVIRYRIFDADKKNILFTAVMEKQTPSVKTSAGGWIYSATNSAGEKIDTGDICATCHQQQAHNNYLFNSFTPSRP
jgi:hypothetical protein